jgi:hypothetical protein
MSCWNIREEINFLWVQIMDGAPIDNDEICNILLGMQQQYDRKFEALFETFTQSHGLDGTDLKDTKINSKEWPEDNDRIDIIGQNGNDGLHYESK